MSKDKLKDYCQCASCRGLAKKVKKEFIEMVEKQKHRSNAWAGHNGSCQACLALSALLLKLKEIG